MIRRNRRGLFPPPGWEYPVVWPLPVCACGRRYFEGEPLVHVNPSLDNPRNPCYHVVTPKARQPDGSRAAGHLEGRLK